MFASKTHPFRCVFESNIAKKTVVTSLFALLSTSIGTSAYMMTYFCPVNVSKYGGI